MPEEPQPRASGAPAIGAPASVRRAVAADVPELARTLARAFFDDPIACWSCRPDELRLRMLERFYVIRLRQVLRHEEVWVEEGLGGGALWLPPGRWRTTPREDAELARCQLHPRLLARMPMVAWGFTGIERRHPASPPHWYLAILGTDPSAQGRGIGSALLRAVLDRCDEDGVAAYLESSKEANVAFYARHGFRVTEEVRLPRGPQAWLMWREPR